MTKIYFFRFIALSLVTGLLSFFSCGNRNPSLSEKQLLELIRGSIQSQTVSQAEQPSTDTVNDESEKTVSENNVFNTDDRPRNTKWADAEGNPRYGYFDVYGRQHTENYFRIHEKPLFNGNEFLEEWEKYMNANNKFVKIVEENNIQEARITISFEFIINTDGSIDAKLNDFSDKHQVLVDEFIRLINAFQEQGKLVPGKHDGKVMKTQLPAISYSIRISEGTLKKPTNPQN